MFAVVVSTVYGNKVWCAYRLHIPRATLARRPRIRPQVPLARSGKSSQEGLRLTRGSTQKKKQKLVFFLPVGRNGGCRARRKDPTGGGLGTTVPRSGAPSPPGRGRGLVATALDGCSFARVTGAGFTPTPLRGSCGGHCLLLYVCIYIYPLRYQCRVSHKMVRAGGGAAAVPHGAGHFAGHFT